jgi:hypothetical protein
MASATSIAPTHQTIERCVNWGWFIRASIKYSILYQELMLMSLRISQDYTLLIRLIGETKLRGQGVDFCWSVWPIVGRLHNWISFLNLQLIYLYSDSVTKIMGTMPDWPIFGAVAEGASATVGARMRSTTSSAGWPDSYLRLCTYQCQGIPCLCLLSMCGSLAASALLPVSMYL